MSDGSITRKNILAALSRIEEGRPRRVAKGRRLSVLAVADEAGTSSSNIHNRYSDLAALIKLKVGGQETAPVDVGPPLQSAEAQLRERLQACELALRKSRSEVVRQALEIDRLLMRLKAE